MCNETETYIKKFGRLFFCIVVKLSATCNVILLLNIPGLVQHN